MFLNTHGLGERLFQRVIRGSGQEAQWQFLPEAAGALYDQTWQRVCKFCEAFALCLPILVDSWDED
eukprot:12880278-Prorocentrum_lima.AAC.1